MNEDKTIPFFVHEADMTRIERTNHRLWILCILLLVALVASNAGWFWYESQFETYEETTVTQEANAEDGSAENRFIGGDYYGESEADNDN